MSIKTNIELDMDQVSEIVRQSLIQDYELNKGFDYVDCSDWLIDPDAKLLEALEVVLHYYSTPDQFKEWKEGLKNEQDSIS